MPDRCQRRSLYVSRKFTELFNIHMEELHSRVANCESRFFYPEVEILGLLLDQMTRGATLPINTSYLRWRLWPGHCLLVKQTFVMTRDKLGRIIQAQYVGQPISVEEWDAVAKRSPCLLYTSPSPRDQRGSRMPSSA